MDETRHDMRTAEITQERERQIAAAQTSITMSVIRRLREENDRLRAQVARMMGAR